MQEYLLPPEERDWSALLAPWNWLLPDAFGVWMANAFGDLFLVGETGEILLLDINAGRLTRLAANQDDFIDKLGASGNAASWLYMPLVDALRAKGLVLEAGQCYAFTKPPLLGGDYHPDNVSIAGFAEHLAFTGNLADQLKDVTDGAEVALKVRGEDYRGCDKADCCSKGPNPAPGSCQAGATS